MRRSSNRTARRGGAPTSAPPPRRRLDPGLAIWPSDDGDPLGPSFARDLAHALGAVQRCAQPGGPFVVAGHVAVDVFVLHDASSTPVRPMGRLRAGGRRSALVVPPSIDPDALSELAPALRRADAVIGQSEHVCGLVGRQGVDRSRTRLIEPGAWAPAGDPASGDPRTPHVLIGGGSGLTSEVVAALRAVRELQTQIGSVVRASIALDQPDLAQLERSVSDGSAAVGPDHGHGRAVAETGIDDAPAWLGLLTSADLAVAPDASSASNAFLVTALAAGVPVVAVDHPYARELLATGAGTTVTTADPRLLSGALERYLRRPQLLAAATHKARRIGRRFDWKRIAASYRVIVRELSLPSPHPDSRSVSLGQSTAPRSALGEGVLVDADAPIRS